MLRELRFAIRLLLKQPGFSLIAALTLGLGIGGDIRGFQFDSGRAAHTAALPEAGAARVNSNGTHRWTEDGQSTRVGGATVDGVAERTEIVRRYRCV